MKILVIGDPHIRKSEIRQATLLVNSIIKSARITKPDQIVVGGDTLDTFSAIHVDALCLAVNFFKELANIAPTKVLVGNHERRNNQDFCSEYHSLAGINYPDLEIIHTTVTHIIKGEKYVFVPYVPPGRFVEALDLNPGWKSAKIIFAHQEFYGVHMGAIVSEEGDEWPDDNPLVITGHIHEYQWLQKNILYVGTPVQQSFSESEDRAILYVTISDKIKYKRENTCPYKRITVKTTCHECMSGTFVMPPREKDYMYRVQVTGSISDLRALTVSKKMKPFQRYAKIVHKRDVGEDGEEFIGTVRNDKTFIERLAEELDEDLLTTHEKILADI